MKEEIPAEVVIGMFHVSCELVRANLVQKCDELMQQVRACVRARARACVRACL